MDNGISYFRDRGWDNTSGEQMVYEAQLTREREMAQRGTARAKAMIGRSLDRGEAGLTPAGVALTKRAIEPVADAIVQLIANAKAGKAGRKHVSAVLLDGIDPDLIAFIAVRGCLNGGSKRFSLKSTALRIGEQLEMEVIADRFEAENSALYRAIVRNARSRGLAPERAAQSVMLANRKFDVVAQPWTSRERMLIGTKLVELVSETLHIISAPLIKFSRTKRHQVQFTPEIEAWFAKYNEASTLTKPLFLPTVVPPKPWTDPYDGAYYTPVMGRATILSRGFPGQIDALRDGDLSAVYKGLNGLQDTAWRVNTKVLEVMRAAWEMDVGLPCLPSREDTPIPPTPQDVQDDERGGPVRKAWRQKMRVIHERNARDRSSRFELARALDIAEENRDRPIYFPHRLDFRGRAYASATSLNPQGSDDVRALCEFHEGKPLGERGVFWLGVHGANLFGNDKVSLEDRYQWALAQIHEARLAADDPLGNLWWTEADKPWCFLAWCLEWGRLIPGRPELCVSHLPIALDGSCNGIQHFSAMLRDQSAVLRSIFCPPTSPKTSTRR
jgi:DNA-directed RNA polymerase